jgi:hypothetical protein
VGVATMLWRAFDKTVRRKPLAFAADAVYGNSIDLELEVVARKGVARKALLLMFVNVLLLAFTPMIVRRGSSSFKRRYACTHTRGSVRRVSGFVLTLWPRYKTLKVSRSFSLVLVSVLWRWCFQDRFGNLPRNILYERVLFFTPSTHWASHCIGWRSEHTAGRAPNIAIAKTIRSVGIAFPLCIRFS